MPLRPLARTLIVPVLGLSLSGLSTPLRCNRCLRAMKGSTGSDGACECGGLIEVGPSRKVVNINTADTEEFARLPRILGWRGLAIVQHRQKNGPFRRIEDLMEVPGIGEKFFATLKPYLAVSGPTTLKEKVRSRS